MVARRYSANLRWDGKLKDRLRRKTGAAFSDARIRRVAYRPFVAAWCYADDAFARALATLHLGYETCTEYPLETVFSDPSEPQAEHFRIGERPMRFADDERTIH